MSCVGGTVGLFVRVRVVGGLDGATVGDPVTSVGGWVGVFVGNDVGL